MKVTKLPYYLILLLALFSSCTQEELTEEITTETLDAVSENARATDQLDYGIYWFNGSNKSKKGFNQDSNKVINVGSSYYDKSKPTVIYFHGWQSGAVQDNFYREDFLFDDQYDGERINTVKKWKDKGWNVGVFYWDQFADESEVKDAEAKIWSKNGPRKLRYRLSDGSYSTSKSPSHSMHELAAHQLRNIMKSHHNKELRFVGHSLGNQLATATAYKLSKLAWSGSISTRLIPDRLELLDPYWSKGSKNYISNQWTGERTRKFIKEMISKENIAVTWYKSSGLIDFHTGDANKSLKKVVAFQNLRFWYVSSWDLATKHINAKHHYFWSLSFSTPKEVKLNWLNQRKSTGKRAASAATSLSRIRAMMGSKYSWDQVEGRYTSTPKDDQFALKTE